MATVNGTNGNDPNLSGFNNSNDSIYGYTTLSATVTTTYTG